MDTGWKSFGEQIGQAEGKIWDDQYEPIDGCIEDNIGRMSIGTGLIHPEL